MVRLFVSAQGQLRERWGLAFPDAQVVSRIAEVNVQDRSVTGSLWLDLSAPPAESRLVSGVAACALGWPVVAMVGVPNEAEAFSLLKAGVQGYCHVEAVFEQLREIALVVEHGGLWMPPELMQRFLAVSTRVVAGAAPAVPELNDLTSRELMVAEQVAHGASNREIAETLAITERTVKAHLSVIFDKLGVRDRVQLALRMNNIPIYSTVN
jgi:two-component system, NarL family, nitrate/nitrite response regulator NarL